MKLQASVLHDDFDDPLAGVEGVEDTSEDDLSFLPGPIEDEPDDLPPGPRAEPRETAVLYDWRKAEANHAARLARVTGRQPLRKEAICPMPHYALWLRDAAAQVQSTALGPVAEHRGRVECKCWIKSPRKCWRKIPHLAGSAISRACDVHLRSSAADRGAWLIKLLRRRTRHARRHQSLQIAA